MILFGVLTFPSALLKSMASPTPAHMPPLPAHLPLLPPPLLQPLLSLYNVNENLNRSTVKLYLKAS